MYEDFNKEGVIPDILTVWQYWENPVSSNIPEYINFCMNSVKRRCYIDGINYVCLNPSNMYDYVNKEDIPKNWHLLEKSAHRADYIRALLLYKHGGLWLDADCICLKSLTQMLDFKNTDIIVFDFKDGSTISSIASRKESLFIKEWLSLSTQILEKTKTFEWGDIGANITTELLKKLNKKIWRKKIYNGLDTCYPLTWDQWEIFFKKGNSDFLMREFQPFIMLYNQMFPNYFKKMTKEQFQEFLKSNVVLADLFRKSLE
jgi:mannosyltransferase OCH1-like enzyme